MTQTMTFGFKCPTCGRVTEASTCVPQIIDIARARWQRRSVTYRENSEDLTPDLLEREWQASVNSDHVFGDGLPPPRRELTITDTAPLSDALMEMRFDICLYCEVFRRGGRFDATQR